MPRPGKVMAKAQHLSNTMISLPGMVMAGSRGLPIIIH